MNHVVKIDRQIQAFWRKNSLKMVTLRVFTIGPHCIVNYACSLYVSLWRGDIRKGIYARMCSILMDFDAFLGSNFCTGHYAKCGNVSITNSDKEFSVPGQGCGRF